GFVLEFWREPACTYPVRDGNLGFLRSVVVGDLRGRWLWGLVLLLHVETFGKNAKRDGSPVPQDPCLRALDTKGDHCALDADAVNDVRRRRTFGRGTGFRC